MASSKQSSSDFARHAVALTGIGVGVYILATSSIDLWQSIRCKDWPQTDGIILGSQVVGERTKPRYHPAVSYDYKVGGVPYVSTRISIDAPFGASAEDAQEVVARYARGKRVRVFYSPTHPEKAVLEPGIFGHTWGGLGAGVMALIISVAPWVSSRRTANEARQPTPGVRLAARRASMARRGRAQRWAPGRRAP